MQRVLIVDDMPDNLYYLEVLLKGNGYEPVSALNGAEALAAARSAPPDLVISDILMPVMDGYALCREWRADQSLQAIPFIFYTATFTEKQDEELALSLGADRFLVKPQDPEVLMTEIARVLAASQEKSSAADGLSDEMRLLKDYNEALFRKLSKKVGELERANSELSQRIEEQKRLEDALRQAQKMEAIGRFAAGVAHDFNNILTVIFGYGGIMRMSDTLQDDMREKLDRILEAAERAGSLASTLLTFSRKQPIRLERLDLNRTVAGVESFLRRVIGNGIDLQVAAHPGPLPVLADKGNLEQVLMNLAANARDAMPRGGTLSIGTSRLIIDDAFVRCHGFGVPGEYVELWVSDTGVGMDPATCRQIFEPFFTTKKSNGTGLGLSIVYGLVQQHKGHIRVESEPERGTSFHILLPLAEEGRSFEPAEASQDRLPRGGETILVVDDEPQIRDYLEMFLTTMGYRVYVAGDGKEAVRLFRLKEGEIDLVLMDVIMPHKIGREAGIEIRNLKPDAKILFMSGYSVDVVRARDLLLEGAEMIVKPLTPTNVAKKVREVLDP
ncbi:response regulator [Geomesophilobacter sediminis]|uniref:histidine kinase n=1 Tax=Geomesophilobacter sediminis TaxID=2798584 RepID=A0A8J7LXL6_9BACT|nr:response regulator [Geomesophilobacter sediminis]MBJ6723316.1 response regulator [Geomesophilobacter sediminis]